MRYTKSELHPVIFEKIKETVASAMSGEMEASKATSQHMSAWFAEYWKGTTAYLLGLVPTLAPLALQSSIGKGPSLAVFFPLFAAWMGLGTFLYKKNQNLATIAELEALRPALNLSENEALYLDCFILVQNSQLLDTEQKHNWSLALREAMERTVELEKIRADLNELTGGTDVHHEVERLESLAESATDPIAKQAYEESLEMAQSRIQRADGAAVQSERIEAHLELTKQTFWRTKEMIRSLQIGQQQAVHIDLDPLRTNLKKVQNDAKLIIDAIEELQQS